MRSGAVNRIAAWALSCALLACTACSREQEQAPATAPSPTSEEAPAATTTDEPKCTNEPPVDASDKRPRCAGMAASPPAPQAYRVVGGSGDPVDQVVCDITGKFVLDGKLFGVELSGGPDGTYTFVRTPNIPGLSWKAGGRYRIEFPDGPGKPGTLDTEGGGTTTAGNQSRDTTGGEHFTLTPAEACTQ